MSFAYTTLDVGGEGNVDLVVTYDACLDDPPGTARWDAYEGACPPV